MELVFQRFQNPLENNVALITLCIQIIPKPNPDPK